MFTQKGVHTFSKLGMTVAENFDFGCREGRAPSKTFGDGLLKVRELAIGRSGMNGGGFVRLDWGDDVHRLFPETDIHRNDLRATRLHFVLPICECIEQGRCAVMPEIGLDATDANTHLRRRRHLNVEQCFSEKRRIAQIAEKPSQSIERSCEMSASAPKVALVRQFDGSAIAREAAKRRRNTN